MIAVMKYLLQVLVIVATSLVVLSACSTSDAQRAGNISPTPTPLPMPAKTFSENDLAKLSWIVGSWKGTGGGATPFYEKYSFRDARTLAVD